MRERERELKKNSPHYKVLLNSMEGLFAENKLHAQSEFPSFVEDVMLVNDQYHAILSGYSYDSIAILFEHIQKELVVSKKYMNNAAAIDLDDCEKHNDDPSTSSTCVPLTPNDAVAATRTRTRTGGNNTVMSGVKNEIIITATQQHTQETTSTSLTLDGKRPRSGSVRAYQVNHLRDDVERALLMKVVHSPVHKRNIFKRLIMDKGFPELRNSDFECAQNYYQTLRQKTPFELMDLCEKYGIHRSSQGKDRAVHNDNDLNDRVRDVDDPSSSKETESDPSSCVRLPPTPPTPPTPTPPAPARIMSPRSSKYDMIFDFYQVDATPPVYGFLVPRVTMEETVWDAVGILVAVADIRDADEYQCQLLEDGTGLKIIMPKHNSPHHCLHETIGQLIYPNDKFKAFTQQLKFVQGSLLCTASAAKRSTIGHAAMRRRLHTTVIGFPNNMKCEPGPFNEDIMTHNTMNLNLKRELVFANTINKLHLSESYWYTPSFMFFRMVVVKEDTQLHPVSSAK